MIARAGHPFLKSVIDRVLANIRSYTPWRLGVGAPGVLRTTGPIAYTLAIAPIRNHHPHRLIRDETTIGLHFSLGGGYIHRQHFPGHYSTLISPLIEQRGVKRLGGALYETAIKAKRALKTKTVVSP